MLILDQTELKCPILCTSTCAFGEKTLLVRRVNILEKQQRSWTIILYHNQLSYKSGLY